MKATNTLRFVLAALMLITVAIWQFVPRNSHEILISDAVAAPIDGDPGGIGVFLKLSNTGGPDRLVGASSEAAATTRIAGPMPTLAIPSASTPSLSADGAFLYLSGVEGDLGDGRTLPVTLKFENAGDISTRARLVAPKTKGAAASFGLFGIGDICQVGEGEPAPKIALRVTEKPEGWEVEVISSDFEFTPDLVDGPHVPGTGHGHLYLDGLKLQRLYAPTASLGALPAGSYEIRVTLNTNDHRAYVLNDVPLTATARLTVD